MKKFSFLLAGLFLIMSAFSVNAQEEKRDEILNNYFKTVGQKKLEKVKTIKMIGKSQNMGREFSFTMYKKDPNMIRNDVDMQGQKFIQAYDGENGWMIAPWISSEPQDLTGQQLKQFKESSDIKGDLYNWKEKGFKLKYIGEDEMEGTPVYKLELTKKSGDVIDYYLDKDSYILLKQKTKTNYNNQEVEVSTYFSNYKMIDGIAIPMNMKSEVMGTSSQIVIDSVQFGVNIPDQFFKKPKSNVSAEQQPKDSTIKK